MMFHHEATSRDKILEMLDNGIIGWQAVCRECLERMSTADIDDMLHECGWDEDDSEEDS